MKATFRGKLIAKRNQAYTLYVFQNLDEPTNSFMYYVTATECPNWFGLKPEIGDIGFVECEYTRAGEEYIRHDGVKDVYRYTNCYFINFIKETENNKDFKI